jgi:hypothetical protein
MVHRIGKIAKGMMFVRDPELKKIVAEDIESLMPEIKFKIQSIVQNIYTGAEMSLFSTDDGRWYIKYSSRDISDFGRDEKSARKHFMKMAGTEGELI